MRQEKNGFILLGRMAMTGILERVGVHDYNPILHMGMGKAICSTPISGKQNKEKNTYELPLLHYL